MLTANVEAWQLLASLILSCQDKIHDSTKLFLSFHSPSLASYYGYHTAKLVILVRLWNLNGLPLTRALVGKFNDLDDSSRFVPFDRTF